MLKEEKDAPRMEFEFHVTLKRVRRPRPAELPPGDPRVHPLIHTLILAHRIKAMIREGKNGLEAGPAKAEAWEELAVHATLLNEGSYLLMEDGRCPDGVWAEAASKTLRESSAEVLKAIEAKDAAAAKTAFEKLTKSCAACHEKHKEKK